MGKHFIEDPERSDRIVFRRHQGLTFAQIGQKERISRQRAQQVYQRAMKRRKESTSD